MRLMRAAAAGADHWNWISKSSPTSVSGAEQGGAGILVLLSIPEWAAAGPDIPLKRGRSACVLCI